MIVRVVLNGGTNPDSSYLLHRQHQRGTLRHLIPSALPHPQTRRLGHTGSASLVPRWGSTRDSVHGGQKNLIEASRAQIVSPLGLQYARLARRFARGACEMLWDSGESSRQRRRNVVFEKLVRGGAGCIAGCMGRVCWVSVMGGCARLHGGMGPLEPTWIWL